MSTIVNDLNARLADRIRGERERRGWSLADLAERAGVSKAMISKIERTEASPTAVLLGRLSGAFGLTLSSLLSLAESMGPRLMRKAEQAQWRDPATGFLRTAISPPGAGPLELVQGELPPGAAISYPAAAYRFISQQIWVLDGALQFHEGETVHDLRAGDCLALAGAADCTFRNSGTVPCRYLVAIARTV
jgi:transcriptional regulator with XRE-family HTH domain